MRFFACLLTFFVTAISAVQSQSWEEAQRTKSGEIEVVWYTSSPFISADASGNLRGVEFELMEAFRHYLKEQYKVDLSLKWTKAGSFSNILETVEASSKKNIFGMSAFSITEDRKEIVQFTDPYLPDVTVLISSEGTPIMRNFSEINEMMSRMDAVTIKGTNFESMLLDIRKQLNVDFDIRYITSEENILNRISQSPDLFGFTDLPIYLLWIQNGSELTRQNFFTVRGDGYGFIAPLSSDWVTPFNEFLANPKYKPEVNEIISRHIGADLHAFIDELDLEDEIGASILTKEKEIQLALIQNANLKLEKEKTFKRFLIFGVLVTVVFLIIIIVLFLINQKSTRILMAQKEQIEEQREDIRSKHEQLINRNAQLVGLNEEKNNLMNILAHDLRSPLSNIIGFSSLYKDAVTETDGRNPMDHIESEAKRMTVLINKILDTKGFDKNQNLVLKEQADVVTVAKEIVTRYLPVAAKKEIEVKFSTSHGQINLDTDQMLLFLILDNLLSNAIKFSPQGRSVEVTVLKDDLRVCINVKDDGPGFSEEDKKKMFKKFQRLSAQPTGDETSTGLGLSIVKKYVTDLGGKVWVESETGAGSTFFVELPL